MKLKRKWSDMDHNWDSQMKWMEELKAADHVLERDSWVYWETITNGL